MPNVGAPTLAPRLMLFREPALHPVAAGIRVARCTPLAHESCNADDACRWCSSQMVWRNPRACSGTSSAVVIDRARSGHKTERPQAWTFGAGFAAAMRARGRLVAVLRGAMSARPEQSQLAARSGTPAQVEGPAQGRESAVASNEQGGRYLIAGRPKTSCAESVLCGEWEADGGTAQTSTGRSFSKINSLDRRLGSHQHTG